MQSLNKNGVSITQTPGEEKYVKCCLGAFRGQIYFNMTTATRTANFSVRWLKRLTSAAASGISG